MKKIIIVLFLIVFTQLLNAQYSISLLPNAINGKDALISMSNSTNLGGNHQLWALAWTYGGTNIGWGLIEFNLSALPVNASITKSTLSLFAWNQSTGAGPHSQLSGDNSMYIERITSPWEENTVLWSTKPSTTASNRISVAGTSNPAQNYPNIDVTRLYRDIQNTNNYGLSLRMQNETPYRLLNFCSSDHTDQTKWPKLVVEYIIVNHSISYSNCSNNSGKIKLNVQGTSVTPTFLWSNGSTADSIINLTSGNYSVIINYNGTDTIIKRYSISSPPPIYLSHTTNLTLCENNYGSLMAIASGGSGTKTYHWSHGLSNSPSQNINPSTSTTYTVYATDANNCSSDTAAIPVTVLPLPMVNSSGLNVAYCSNSGSVTLSGIPSGGSFSGPGITGSVFNPSNASTGQKNIIYSYTDANSCTNRDTQTTTVYAAPQIQFSGLAPAYCNNNAAVDLSSKATPTGGTFFVNSVATTSFNPVALGTGTHKIRYSVSNAYGCSDVDSVSVYVNPVTDAAFSGLSASYCKNSSAATLIGTPSGGVFWGTGVAGSSFNPANATVGSNLVSYRYTNIYNCTDTFSQATTVNALTPLTLSTPDNIFCNSDAAVAITASPAGGILSGNGVNNSAKTFNPASATLGSNVITYTFSNPYGCISTATHNVTVNAPAALTLNGLAANFCLNNAPATLSPNPAGGVISGAGIVSAKFYPSAAGVGTHSISYIYDNGCIDTLTSAVTVHALPTMAISGLDTAYCYNNPPVAVVGSPSGGTLSGNGISGLNFSATNAGVGVHLIRYISDVDAHGCIDTAFKQLEVFGIPNISFGSLVADQCISTDSVSLAATPAGGAYSGTAISGNVFSSSTAGVGSHKIYYSVTIGNLACSNVDSFTFSVHSLPSLTFLGGNTCANIPSMTLSALPSGGTFSGTFVSGNNFAPISSGVGSFPVTYSFTDAYNCTNNTTQNIIVNAIPVINFIMADTHFCVNEAAVNLVATPLGGSFAGNGVIGSSFTPANAALGNNPISYTYTDLNLCSNSKVHQAVVHALPVVNFVNTPVSYCSNGTPQLLSATPSGGTFLGSGVTGANFYPALTSPGSIPLFYHYTDAFSCSSSDTLMVVVNAPPVVAWSGLNTSYCKNDLPDTLTLNPLGGYFNNAAVVNGIFMPSLADTGGLAITYSFTDANNCSASQVVNTHVYQNPSIDAGQDSLIPCNSNGVVLGEVAQSGNTYLWAPYAGLNNPFAGNPTANPWNTTWFVVTKTHLASQCTAKDSVLMSVPVPLQVFISGDTNLCAGDSLHLLAAGSENYVWSYGITGENFDFKPMITQYIKAQATDSNNCVSVDSVLALLNPLPIPNLGFASDTVVINDSLVLSPGSFNTYLWSNGSSMSSMTLHYQSGLVDSLIWVQVENEFGCQGSDTIRIFFNNIDGDFESIQLKVFPNPSQDVVKIEFGNLVYVNSIQLMDLSGKVVQSISVEDFIQSYSLNINALPVGAYLLQINLLKMSKTLKILRK